MDYNPLINTIISRITKQFFNFDESLENLKLKFEKVCPSKENLKQILLQKNQIQSTLTQTLAPLNTLKTTSTTVGDVLTIINSSIIVIKSIPIPTAVPPGIGIPINIITKLSDVLIFLQDIVKQGKGTIKNIPKAIKSLKNLIENSLLHLDSLDILINKCITKKIEEEFGSNPTQTQINQFYEEIGYNPNEEYTITIPEFEEDNPQDLINQLLDEENPISYKRFQLSLEINPNKIYMLDSFRIKGTLLEDSRIYLYNTINRSYSYCPNPRVLIEEIKFRIDNTSFQQTPLR